MTPTQRTHKRGEGACEWCGDLFSKTPRGKPYRFCSRDCGVRGRGGPTRRAMVAKACAVCGRGYEIKSSHAIGSKYCSNKCKVSAIDHSGVSNPNFKGGGQRVCEGCSAMYVSYNKARRFCSEECGWANAPEESVRNGRRGYDAELKCCSELSSRGMTALRSAASRGPFDVVAFGMDGAISIQVKRTKDPSRRRHPKVVKEIAVLGAPVTEANRKQLWCWVDRKGWFVVDIKPDGSTIEGWGLDWVGLPPVIQGELNVMRDVS